MTQIPAPLFSAKGSAMPVMIDDPRMSTIFGLGQTQMRPDGTLRENWLLAEALNRHRAAIAARLGTRSSDLADTAGNALRLPVECVRISGLGEDFCDGDTVALDMGVVPAPETAWRSLTNLRSQVCETIRVEIITSFQRADCKGAPDLPAPLTSRNTDPAAHRATDMAARGAAWQAAADLRQVPHCADIEIAGPLHLNGAGLLDADMLLQLADRADASHSADPNLVILERELHVFDTPRDGERVSIDVSNIREAGGERSYATFRNGGGQAIAVLGTLRASRQDSPLHR